MFAVGDAERLHGSVDISNKVRLRNNGTHEGCIEMFSHGHTALCGEAAKLAAHNSASDFSKCTYVQF